MKNINWLITIIITALLITPGYSLVVRSGQSVNIAENEIIDDDLIAFARTIIINGKVNGDVWAFAQDITVTGEVDGLIITAGSTIDINVKKAKTIMAAGGNINVSGPIKNNVLLFGGSLLLAKDAKVGKDLIVYGGQLNVKGKLDGKIKGGVGDFVMEGQSGNIDISAETVKIKSAAQISGDLIVRSEQEPVIEPGAKITGETKLEKPKKEEGKKFFAFAPFIAFIATFLKIIMLIAKIIVGLLFIALCKRYVRRIMDTLIKAPWKSLGWGFLGLVVIPVAALILFVILIGYPLAIFGIYIYTLLFYLSSIFVALVLGEKVIQLFKKEGAISLYLSFIVGILLIFVLGLIPILGFIINIFVLLLGAGMLLIGTWDIIKEVRGKELI